MVTHIVMIKLRERVPEVVERVRAALAALPGKIPQLRHFEVGADVLHTERSYDLALIARFDSLEDLQAYQVHPAHQEVVKYIGTVREAIVAVDYEGK